MRAMQIEQFGPPSALRLMDAPVPEPGANDVLIRAAYASINPADWKCRAGLLPHLSAYTFPITIGMDCAGVIERVGADVVGFRPGDRVISLSGMGQGMQGTYAEFSSAPQQRVAHLPKHLTIAQGATIPIASASAASSIIDVAKSKPGDAVLVNGGAGSVGTFAIQYLKHIGARVAATCSTRNIDHVRSLGADLVIDYTATPIASVRDWAPKGLDAVLDAVGQHSLPRNMPNFIRPHGILVCIQNLLTGPESFDLELAGARHVRVLDNVVAAYTSEPSMFQVAAFRQLLGAIDAGAIRVPPFEIISLEKAAEGQARVEEGHVRGKILLHIADL